MAAVFSNFSDTVPSLPSPDSNVPFQLRHDHIPSRQVAFIPYGPQSRNIVLVFDGTDNQFGPGLTSLPSLYGLLDANATQQRLYYQAGVGTYVSEWSPTGFFKRISLLADAAVAWGLGQHVQDGYQFLSDWYEPGDRIYLLGFSRGSYTARALAGMLQQVGLLLPGNEESVPFAYKIYAKGVTADLVPGGESLAAGFKRCFSRDVRVHFVGVYDTVSSVGGLIPRTLPFSAGSSMVTYFRHCVSLNERRIRFSLQPWIPDLTTPITADAEMNSVPRSSELVKEVWYCGAHSDVGGGQTVTDGDTKPRLSHIPLRWMVREALECGLEFDIHALETSPIFNHFIPLAQELLDSTSQSDEEAKAFAAYYGAHNFSHTDKALVAIVWVSTRPNSIARLDALAPRGDILSFRIEHDPTVVGFGARFKAFRARMSQRLVTAGWWILELLPALNIVWDVDGRTRTFQWKSNLGRSRAIPPNPTFHWSVRERLNATPEELGGQGNNSNVPDREYKLHAHFTGQGDSLETIEWDDG